MNPRPVAALFPVAVAAAIACGDPSHIFVGRAFLADRDCLGPTSSVDVVSGDAPGVCAPTCLVQPILDGGHPVYVATMCGPYPFGFDTTGVDPRCAPALAAYARNDACISDAGSTHPTDAGTD